MIYQIFLRTFTPEGTLAAAEKLLGHIKSLGCDYIYLCPTFVHDQDDDPKYLSARQKACGLGNPSNPYRMKDFYHTDPEYGTDEDLRRFVESAHTLGMKVMFDLVYFHCGPKAVFLDEHPDFIVRGEDGDVLLGEWAFPMLNYDNPELREYMWQNMEYLVREFDADGFRCDVGDRVPIDFWIEGRRRVKAIKSDFIMLIEGLYEPRWREAFDLIYEFWLSKSMKDVLSGNQPAAHIAERRKEYEDKYIYGGTTLLNWENHDYANDAYDKRPDAVYPTAAVETMLLLIFTLRGEPFLYAGNEIADSRRHSIWGNRFHSANLIIDWQNALTAEGAERLKLVRTLSALRHERPELSSEAGIEFVDSGDEGCLAFIRESDAGALAVIVNLRDRTALTKTSITIGKMKPVLMRGAALSRSENGNICAELKPYGFAIVKIK